MKGERFQYILIRISNLKSEMTLALTVKILNQALWNFCMKKGETLNLLLSIDHPTTKQNHLKTF